MKPTNPTAATMRFYLDRVVSAPQLSREQRTAALRLQLAVIPLEQRTDHIAALLNAWSEWLNTRRQADWDAYNAALVAAADDWFHHRVPPISDLEALLNATHPRADDWADRDRQRVIHIVPQHGGAG